ncbi:hypothetical protein [Empedobacter sp. GD03797]|uniref:hypothetical protein n=1 Tax=Empedobacter sp. GD03797 TaxID=2975382 RepID=UPI0024470DCC|nr:hypothetical protein [Empedobacter sp. GD03797]MDH1883580.1 hypothetical protein [Empedobacter sp. GD03797]
MKNYRLLLTLFIFSIFTLTIYAQDCDPDDPDCTGTTPPPPTNVPGKPATPIDDYVPLLVITAISIAGIVSYKQRLIIKK